MTQSMIPAAADTSVSAAGLFDSMQTLAHTALGLLALIALVVGAVSAIRAKAKEGTGAAITEQIGGIILAVLIFMGAGIGYLLTNEARDAGVPAPTGESPWGR